MSSTLVPAVSAPVVAILMSRLVGVASEVRILFWFAVTTIWAPAESEAVNDRAMNRLNAKPWAVVNAVVVMNPTETRRTTKRLVPMLRSENTGAAAAAAAAVSRPDVAPTPIQVRASSGRRELRAALCEASILSSFVPKVSTIFTDMLVSHEGDFVFADDHSKGRGGVDDDLVGASSKG